MGDPDHPLNAAHTAIAMIKAINKLKKGRKTKGIEKLNGWGGAG